MKIMIVVGARPNFMKAAPLITAIKEHNRKVGALPLGKAAPDSGKIQAILVHTGQHYDKAMSDSFFVDLELAKPDVHLGVGSGSHAAQTAEIMRRFEEVLLREKPDALVVAGDVNSTVACALVAAKISWGPAGSRPLIAHVEAGLRSFDREMPEEINRIMTDHLSDLLFVTEQSGVENLRREGVPENKICFVGNTMIDSVLAFKEKAEKSTILKDLGLRTIGDGNGSTNGQTNGQANGSGNGAGKPEGRYALLTLHRPSNVDDRETFLSILEGLDELSASYPIVFSAHPRTRKRIVEFGLEHFFQPFDGEAPASGARPARMAKGIQLLEPLGYLDFLCLMKHATVVVTDSGGIQEETTCLGVPCVTVRENTERPVTVTCGTNVIAGTKKENIRKIVSAQLGGKSDARVPAKWDGKAGARIIETIASHIQNASSTDETGEEALLGKA